MSAIDPVPTEEQWEAARKVRSEIAYGPDEADVVVARAFAKREQAAREGTEVTSGWLKNHAGLEEYAAGVAIDGGLPADGPCEVQLDSGPQPWMGQTVALLASRVKDAIEAVREESHERSSFTGFAMWCARLNVGLGFAADEMDPERAVSVALNRIAAAREAGYVDGLNDGRAAGIEEAATVADSYSCTSGVNIVRIVAKRIRALKVKP